jgi:hypothetical protein
MQASSMPPISRRPTKAKVAAETGIMVPVIQDFQKSNQEEAGYCGHRDLKIDQPAGLNCIITRHANHFHTFLLSA